MKARAGSGRRQLVVASIIANTGQSNTSKQPRRGYHVAITYMATGFMVRTHWDQHLVDFGYYRGHQFVLAG